MAARSDVGVLTVYMDAVTDQFHAGLKKAQSSIGDMRGSMRTMSKGLRHVEMVVAAAQSAVDLFRASNDLITADGVEEANSAWMKMADTIKGLPAIGQSATQIYDFLMDVTGTAAEIERLNKAFEENERVVKAALANHKKYLDITEELTRSTESLQDELHRLDILERGGDEQASYFADQMKHHRERQALIRELEEAQAGEGRFEGIMAMEREPIVAQLQERLRLHNEIGLANDRIAEQGRVALQTTKDQAVEDQRLLDLKVAQNKLAASQEDRLKVRHADLTGSANTFTSPMGTISLPALNTTAELARLQLTELRAIDQTISGLETTIKDLSKP